MHITEGWLLFVVSLALTAGAAWLIGSSKAVCAVRAPGRLAS